MWPSSWLIYGNYSMPQPQSAPTLALWAIYTNWMDSMTQPLILSCKTDTWRGKIDALPPPAPMVLEGNVAENWKKVWIALQTSLGWNWRLRGGDKQQTICCTGYRCPSASLSNCSRSPTRPCTGRPLCICVTLLSAIDLDAHSALQTTPLAWLDTWNLYLKHDQQYILAFNLSSF